MVFAALTILVVLPYTHLPNVISNAFSSFMFFHRRFDVADSAKPEN